MTRQVMYLTVTICRRVTGSVSQQDCQPLFSSSPISDAGSVPAKNMGYSIHTAPPLLSVDWYRASPRKITSISRYVLPKCHRLRASL